MARSRSERTAAILRGRQCQSRLQTRARHERPGRGASEEVTAIER